MIEIEGRRQSNESHQLENLLGPDGCGHLVAQRFMGLITEGLSGGGEGEIEGKDHLDGMQWSAGVV